MTTIKGTRLTSGLAFAFLLLLGQPVSAQTPAALSDAEIKEMTSDRAYDGVSAQGGKLQIRYVSTGTMTITGVVTDNGRYRIDAGRLCSTWTRIRNGQEICNTIHRGADGKLVVRNPDGSLNTTLTRLP